MSNIQSGHAKEEEREKAAAVESLALDEPGVAKPATIPLTSGRALAVGYLQGLIDGGMEGLEYLEASEGGSGRARELTSALHDELAYLLMEGLLVSSMACVLWVVMAIGPGIV